MAIWANGDTYLTTEAIEAVLPERLSASKLKSTVRRQVANRAAFPAFSRNVTNTGGTNTQAQQIQSFVLTEDVADLAFTLGNFHRDSAGDMALAGLSNVTVRLAIWDGTTTYPVFWPNGSRDCIIEPGGIASSTPTLFKGRKGQRVWLVRRMTWATAPTAFPAGTVLSMSANEANEWGTALTDRTSLTSPLFYTKHLGNWAVFPPLAITSVAKPGPVVAILGDSIASDGASDYNTDDLDYGWAQGALSDAGIPWINLGTASLQLSHVLSSKPGRSQLFAAFIAAGVTHLLVALSTNDWAGGRTAAQVLANLATLKDELSPLGIKVVAVTSLPKTNSANNGQVSGETATFAQRAIHNDTLRANNGVGDGVLDLASFAEDPNNKNLWRTDLRAPTSVTIAAGGSGYAPNDIVYLPGGVSFGVNATAGAVSAVYTPTGLGGWVQDPPETVSPIKVLSNNPATQGVPSAGTGAKFTFVGVGPVASVADGTHPPAPLTRYLRQRAAVVAPELFKL